MQELMYKKKFIFFELEFVFTKIHNYPTTIAWQLYTKQSQLSKIDVRFANL